MKTKIIKSNTVQVAQMQPGEIGYVGPNDALRLCFEYEGQNMILNLSDQNCQPQQPSMDLKVQILHHGTSVKITL